MTQERVVAICPSRDRPTQLDRLVTSFLATSTHARLVIVIDSDQSSLYDLSNYGARVTAIVQSSSMAGPAGTYNQIVSSITADVYGAVVDDSEFMTVGWDDFVLNTRNGFPGKVGLVSAWNNVCMPRGDDSPQIDYVQFPFVTREWVSAVGFFSYPKCVAYCWDTILDVIGDETSIKRCDKEEFHMRHHAMTSDNEGKYLRQDALEAVFYLANGRRKTVARLKKAMSR
jgi:hypothetical protein